MKPSVHLFLPLLAPFSLAGDSPPRFAGFDGIDPTKSCFIAIGDTQRPSNWEFWRDDNYAKTATLVEEIACRAPALVIHLGDLTARGSSEKHWEFFDRAHAPLIEKGIPCCPILGNHEYYGRNRTVLGQVFRRFPHIQGRTWYSSRFKGVGIIALNSNFGALSSEEMDRQNQWYLKELASMEGDPAIRFIVVCSHHPPYSNAKMIPRVKEVEQLFAEPFLKGKKTAFFLSGHCHTYERFLQDGKHFIVSGGGGAPRHTLNVDEKTREFQDEFKGPAVRPFHFCQLEIQEKALLSTAVALNEDGSFAEIDRAEFAAPKLKAP